jgi:MFS family permease
MVGLVQFLPTALLVFVAGHAADRFERKRVVQLCQLAEAATALFLAVSTFAGWLTVPQIFIATFVIGIAGAFESPATAALLPLIVPKGSVQRATAISSGPPGRDHHRTRARRVAYVFAPSLPYFVIVAFWLVGAFSPASSTREAGAAKADSLADDVFCRRPLHPQQPGDPRHHLARPVRRAVRRRRGAAADLCARHSGSRPLGLGILRAAPAVGALLMTIVLARHSINRHVGLADVSGRDRVRR